MKNKIVLAAALLFLQACSESGIEGKWVEPVSGMPDVVQGFMLYPDGRAESVNMATLHYEKWEKKGNTLVLSGKSIGNRQTIDFSETLPIEKLDSDNLVVKRGNLSVSYSRQE